jgi:hypothetical protein
MRRIRLVVCVASRRQGIFSLNVQAENTLAPCLIA